VSATALSATTRAATRAATRAVRGRDTIDLAAPVTMIPGPHGRDSPAILGDMPRWRWYAWIDLAEDRAALRPSHPYVLHWALGHHPDDDWPLWWHAPDPDTWRVHHAQVDDVDGGGPMLLAACGRSTPADGVHPDDVAVHHGRELTADVALCHACTGHPHDGYPHGGHRYDGAAG
jgi:hypothetical protein